LAGGCAFAGSGGLILPSLADGRIEVGKEVFEPGQRLLDTRQLACLPVADTEQILGRKHRVEGPRHRPELVHTKGYRLENRHFIGVQERAHQPLLARQPVA